MIVTHTHEESRMPRKSRTTRRVRNESSPVDVIVPAETASDVIPDTTSELVEVTQLNDDVPTNHVESSPAESADDHDDAPRGDDKSAERERHVAALLHALRHDETLTSRDKKTIRRTLRDKYDYYISRNRGATSNVVSRILTTATSRNAS